MVRFENDQTVAIELLLQCSGRVLDLMNSGKDLVMSWFFESFWFYFSARPCYAALSNPTSCFRSLTSSLEVLSLLKDHGQFVA